MERAGGKERERERETIHSFYAEVKSVELKEETQQTWVALNANLATLRIPHHQT